MDGNNARQSDFFPAVFGGPADFPAMPHIGTLARLIIKYPACLLLGKKTFCSKQSSYFFSPSRSKECGETTTKGGGCAKTGKNTEDEQNGQTPKHQASNAAERAATSARPDGPSEGGFRKKCRRKKRDLTPPQRKEEHGAAILWYHSVNQERTTRRPRGWALGLRIFQEKGKLMRGYQKIERSRGA